MSVFPPCILVGALLRFKNETKSTHTHARTLARMHARTHARTHTRTHARTHARTHTHTHIYIYTKKKEKKSRGKPLFCRFYFSQNPDRLKFLQPKLSLSHSTSFVLLSLRPRVVRERKKNVWGMGMAGGTEERKPLGCKAVKQKQCLKKKPNIKMVILSFAGKPLIWKSS